jgi:uncharacterized protein YhhL (DUF1145 family)
MIARLLARIPWTVLLKLRMLVHGQLARPIDIFDLLMHGTPLLLVMGKLLAGRATSAHVKHQP